MNKARFLDLLMLLTVTLIAPACQPTASLAPASTPTVSLTPFASLSGTPGTAAPPLQPTQYLEFSNLSEAQTVAKFSVWLPKFIPDDLPFSKAWISDFADGSENVRIVYAEPGNPLDANLKMLDLQLTKTDKPISGDVITHQFKVNALDVREVQVRGQTGFTYWTQSVAAGNSAILTWREGTLNIRLSLSGAWPQPDESNPHGLDSMLLKIAESLQTVSSAFPMPAVTVRVLPPTIQTATPACRSVASVVPFVFCSPSIDCVS